MASAFACAERLTGIRLTPQLLDDHDDWLAIGHHPLDSLRDAGSWAEVDKANAERQACEEDPRRCSIPNRLLWGDDVYDATNLFVLGWVGWIQLFLCWTATAALVAMKEGLAPGYLYDMSGPGILLVMLALFVLTDVLVRVAGAIDRVWRKRSAVRAEMADLTP